MNRRTTIGLLVAGLSCIPAFAQPASTDSISLQAKLEGVPGPTVGLTVRFYDAASGGTQVTWPSCNGSPDCRIDLPGVPVQNGIVSVPLSPIDPSVFNGQTRYMGVSVNGGSELSPRTLVTSVPYATRAITGGDSLGVFNVEQKINLVRTDGQASLVIGRSSDPGTGTAGYVRLTGEDGFLDFQTSQDAVTWSQALRVTKDSWLEAVRPDGAGVMVFGRTTGPQTGFMRLVGENGFLDFQTSEDKVNWTQVMRLENDGRTIVKVLTITGGSDVAEPVAITPTPQVAKAEHGMVMVIDREHDGRIVPCSAAYDKAVAGVLSGANGLNPGMVLSAEGTALTAAGDDSMPLAMTGRVWVLCDATTTPVRRGDSLTTSPTPGHAMVVGDETKRAGAVIGKAMTELKEGKGLVLVLVNLQ